jgi:hypothetical protein
MDAAAPNPAMSFDFIPPQTKRPRIGALAHQESQSQTAATISSLQTLSLGADIALPDLEDDERSRFRTIKMLGHGAYAWVEEVYDEKEKASLAMKVIRLAGNPRQRAQAKLSVQKEVAILRRISGHRHIVKLHSAFAYSGLEGPRFYVLVEPVANCDLGVYYENCALRDFPKHMTEPVREWFSCLAFGLEFIHSQKIRHKGMLFLTVCCVRLTS